MSRFFQVVAFGTAMLLAPGLLFSQNTSTSFSGTFSSSMSSVGPGGSLSARGNGAETIFTYNYPSGEAVFIIAGAPYSGRMSSQNVRTLANGIHLNMQTNDQPMTCRDSAGRTRTDSTMSQAPMVAAAANIPPRIVRLPEISDPVAGFRYVLDDTNRIAHRIPIQARQNPNQTQPRAALPAPPPLTMKNGVTSTTESLGTQSMSGITVTGLRNTTTYPPGTFEGNDGPLASVEETWRSEQYGLMMLSKNTSPDGSESTMTMKDFSAAEPDSTLFMVPAGYQIVDETGQFTITVPAGAK